MKKLLIIIHFILVLLFACTEKENKIEIISNLEAVYLSENEVDIPAEFKDENFDAENSLISAIKSIHKSSTDDTSRYILSFRFYINEMGRVEKIKDISTYYERLEIGTDGIKNYTDRNKLSEAIASVASDWELVPAKIDNMNVESYVDLKKVNIIALPNKKFELELSDFLSFFSSNKKFRTSADEMPFPIGGLSALTKNVAYPEGAKKKGIEGKVFVVAFIDETGKVVNARVVKGENPLLNESAIDAVMKTKFTPGRNAGEPVKVQVTIPIVFKLQ